MTLEERYQRLCQTPSSINEHLPTLRRYAEQCQSVCEFGVDIGQSTTAFLMACPEYLYSYDVVMCPDLLEINQAFGAESLPRLKMGEGFTLFVWNGEKKGRWHFHLDDSRTCHIPEVDLLFIDSDHCYSVIKSELERHAAQVRKHILIHDTFSFGVKGADGGVGIVPAIGEFLVAHREWAEEVHYAHNNGLQVLRRVDV